jgi:hypothetical protein
MTSALTVDRLRKRVGIDEAIGAALTAMAIVLTLVIGIHDARRAVYGPIDEVTHTAYVLAVAKDGIPPELGRDRAFVGSQKKIAPRDVRIPAPDKVGSAAIPVGYFGEVKQDEAIQPPLYYYVAAPVTWFVSGRDKVVALRMLNVVLCLITLLLIFFAVRDLAGSPLGGGIAAMLFASAGGVISVFAFVTNGAIMLTLGMAAIWLSARGIRDRRVTWPLVAVAGAFAITQIIVVPLAAACLLAPVVWRARAEGRPAFRSLGTRVGVAAVPLFLWVLSNLVRYHWVIPKAPGTTGLGGFGTSVSDTNVNVFEFGAQYYLSVQTMIDDSFKWWTPSPYVYDWRPLALFAPLTLVGIALALFRGTQRQRTAIGTFLVAVVSAHLLVFLMLYLAVILTGGGDFVYRYFSASEAAAACLGGVAFTMLFRNRNVERVATIAAGLALAYWTYSASPL